MMIPTLPWLVHDPVITTLGYRKSKQAADSIAMLLSPGNESSHMPLKKMIPQVEGQV